MRASPQILARHLSVPCIMTGTLGHLSPVGALAGPMPKTPRAVVPASDLQEHPVHLQDQQRQDVAPSCPQPPEWLQKQDAHFQALHEGLTACRMAMQSEVLERSNAVAQLECTLKALILVERQERNASIGSLHADLRVTDARLHELLNALDEESEKPKWQSVSIGHQAKSRHVSPCENHQTQEQVASTQGTGGPPITMPVAVAEAEVEADGYHPVPGSEEIELVKVPKMPGNEPLPAIMEAMRLDKLAMAGVEQHAASLDDLKGTLDTRLRDMQQGLWHALEHEMSERKQLENRTIHSFETLKESLQAPLVLAKQAHEQAHKAWDQFTSNSTRAQEQAQKAWDQFASASTTTTSKAEMVAQAAQAAQKAFNATCMDDAPAIVAKRSQQPAQAPIQESVQQPLQQLVSMEETHACGAGDGAAGLWPPVGLKAQTVDSTQLENKAEPPVPCQDDSTIHSSSCSASDPSGVLIQSREALNLNAQVAPQSSRTDNSDLPRDKNCRARCQEITQRIESSYVNQAEAVELALRAMSAEQVPGSPRPLDSDRNPTNTLVSNIGSSPVPSKSDVSTLVQSGGFVSGQDEVRSRYLLRHSMHDGPEVIATAESSP